jgi:membrane-bound serine protease (ClpP class)
MRTLLLLSLCAASLPAAGVLRVDIDGVVHPVTVEIVSRAIEQAQRDRADLILLRLDTPGGLLDATRGVVAKIASSPIPVVTWVGPNGARAASAGFFLLLAGDAAAMAPGTRAGAAAPVLLGREMDAIMRKKVESDASAWMRTIAASKGRDGALAEKAVTEAKSWTEQEALAAKLVDFIAGDEAALLRQLDGRELRGGVKLRVKDASVTRYEPTLRQSVIATLADPNISFLLLIAGALGLYLEFTTPGVILPGVLGGILGLLGLAGLSVLPINWIGAALLLLAVGLLVAEAFVTSHGVLGVGGAVAFVLGAVMLVDGPPGVRIGWGVALGAGLPFAGIAIFLTTLVLRVHKTRSSTGESGMIGQTAVARTPLDLDGKVFVHGEYWDATSSVPVPEGATVRVVAVDGLRLQVEPAKGLNGH